MQNICLYFQVHQPYRLSKRYRFFEIGENHYYYDDYENRMHMERIARDAYLPTNRLILDLIEKYGDKFKISFSITGTAIEQFEQFAPEVLESFKDLAKTGNVEFLAETYSHSLSSLRDKDEFKMQVRQHAAFIEKTFGIKPLSFRNTELIYDNLIGEAVFELGFKTVLTEGAKHILGWKSPNRLYFNPNRPEQKILLRNYQLSDDIAFRFSDKNWSESPLTADKYAKWLNQTDKKDSVINLFMDYETFGEHQKKETGIFDFLENLPKAVIEQTELTFATPSEIARNHDPVASMHVPHAISWADEERDVTAWLGNEMQEEAFAKLKELSEKIHFIPDYHILRDWNYLQTSDHFYYMSTKILSDGMVHNYFNPYSSPYHAFINYMNILSDFALRVNEAYEKYRYDNKAEIEDLIKQYQQKIDALKKRLKDPQAIEKMKPEYPVIEGSKLEIPAIDKTKEELKALEKAKSSGKRTDRKKKASTRKASKKKTSTPKTSRNGKKTPKKPGNKNKT